MQLQGLFPALTTPFRDGRFDAAALVDNIARYESVDLGGYLVLGSTGEAVLLDDGDRDGVLEAARRAVPQGKALIAGVGVESTAAACKQARVAALRGADAVLVGTPHYYREHMTAAALTDHFRAVADVSPVPILLYSVPKFTGLAVPSATIDALAGHPNVAGIKDSAGDPTLMQDTLRRVPERFAVLCGDAGLYPRALAAGAVGGILAAACFVPEPLQSIAPDARAGALDRIADVHRVVMTAISEIHGRHGIAGIKAAMDARGLAGGEPRRPLTPLSGGVRGTIGVRIDELVETGLLPTRNL